MTMALPMLFALASSTPACFPVQGDQIYGRDLAAASPDLDRFPADIALGFAPLAGAKRVLTAESLKRLAQAHQIPVEITSDLCFERAMVALAAGTIQEAMQTALRESSTVFASAHIDVGKWGPDSVPQGTIVFPMTSLALTSPNPQGEVLWRGYVAYGRTHRSAIWAWARISGVGTRVVAVSSLPAGKPIGGEQVRLESCDTCLTDPHVARRLDEVIGFAPRTLIRSGVAVLKSQLRSIPEVSSGDLVTVQVEAGAAHLLLEGRAQTSASAGGTVRVRNLGSGKDFQATVVSRGIVRVGQ